MSDFVETCIAECCDILDSQRIPLNEEERSKISGSIPYYGANGVQGYINDFIFDEPLILIAEDGGYFEEYASRPIAYRVYGKSWVNNHAHILRAKHGYNQDYIFYTLEHKNIVVFIKGGTRAKLNQAELRDVIVSIPILPEQHKIAKILFTVDNLIEKTRALIDKYQSIKQGMMHDLFTRGVDEHGQLRPSYEEAPHLYKESELGWIPKEWKMVALGSLTEKITSGSRGWAPFYAEEGDLFMRIGNLTREHINFRFDDVVRVALPRKAEGARTQLEAGDVLISITADLGIIGVVPAPFETAYVNQHIALVRCCSHLVNQRWLGHFLASRAGQLQFERLNDSGAKAGLNLPTIGALKIAKPNDREQVIVQVKLDKVDVCIHRYFAELSKLRCLKSGLMQDLLTGKVRVNVDSKEECAALIFT